MQKKLVKTPLLVTGKGMMDCQPLNQFAFSTPSLSGLRKGLFSLTVLWTSIWKVNKGEFQYIVLIKKNKNSDQRSILKDVPTFTG